MTSQEFFRAAYCLSALWLRFETMLKIVHDVMGIDPKYFLEPRQILNKSMKSHGHCVFIIEAIFSYIWGRIFSNQTSAANASWSPDENLIIKCSIWILCISRPITQGIIPNSGGLSSWIFNRLKITWRLRPLDSLQNLDILFSFSFLRWGLTMLPRLALNFWI